MLNEIIIMFPSAPILLLYYKCAQEQKSKPNHSENSAGRSALRMPQVLSLPSPFPTQSLNISSPSWLLQPLQLHASIDSTLYFMCPLIHFYFMFLLIPFSESGIFCFIPQPILGYESVISFHTCKGFGPKIPSMTFSP
uniref:Uncharacterized protein n=1 Tax=Pipistrellus kuhlii TaxID=59472 RepID=A0A7J7YXG8_PIPKU|nr:hypothetical protein mPipKuh1_009897 [Pipistrellus kuhlii]